jgi:hypothetical protein
MEGSRRSSLHHQKHFGFFNQLVFLHHPMFFVRMKGLEPPHLAASDPKSDVSTNSTTSGNKKNPVTHFPPKKAENWGAKIRKTGDYSIQNSSGTWKILFY